MMVRDISRRAFLTIGVAVSLAFSTLLAACTGRVAYSFELDELEYMNGLTREELNERLRALAELSESSDVDVIIDGATCYMPLYREPEYTPLPCSTCSANAQMEDWQITSLESIQAIVNEMISAGFDVELDFIISCKQCAGGSSARYRAIFGIRFKDDADYHMVETTDITDYKILLAFLREDEYYIGDFGTGYPLYRQLEVIEKMTGLRV